MTTCISLGSALDFGYIKIAPNAFDTGTGIYSMSDLVVNLDTWNKLPKSVQDAINSTAIDFFMKRQFELLDAKNADACAAFKKVFCEKSDVVTPLPQRRDLDRKDIEAVEEIRAKAPLLDVGAQIPVTRSDHAHVDADAL